MHLLMAVTYILFHHRCHHYSLYFNGYVPGKFGLLHWSIFLEPLWFRPDMQYPFRMSDLLEMIFQICLSRFFISLVFLVTKSAVYSIRALKLCCFHSQFFWHIPVMLTLQRFIIGFRRDLWTSDYLFFITNYRTRVNFSLKMRWCYLWLLHKMCTELPGQYWWIALSRLCRWLLQSDSWCWPTLLPAVRLSNDQPYQQVSESHSHTYFVQPGFAVCCVDL